MIIALHGFLGLPSDWLHFDGIFHETAMKVHTVRKWDLYADLPQAPPNLEDFPLRTWARTFCERIERGWKNLGDEDRTKPVLLGYSMGGRLALHALLENPNLFSAAIIVGGHPGLMSDDFKMQRRLNDAKWAERIRAEPWLSLLKAWGEQDVFSSAKKPEAIVIERQEVDFDRILLSRAMQLWSLSNQQDLRAELASVSVPTLWISGTEDRRFRELYRELQMDLIDSPAHRFTEVPQAGHRVPWDNPMGFSDVIQNFLKQI